MLIDKNSVEGYIDNGKLHIAEALKKSKSETGIQINGDVVIHSMELYEMNSIW
jgi:hypothetical protein